MKKIIGIILIIVIMISMVYHEEEVIIPQEAIRFRVIANSNKKVDQTEKRKLAKTLGQEVEKSLQDADSLNDARNILKNNVNQLNTVLEEEMQKDNYQVPVKINYGMNYFPEKTYKGVKYEEGEYESLVVTLGKGEGNNFWCVLFPPLCLLEAEEEDTKDVKYTSFVKELIDKYF